MKIKLKNTKEQVELIKAMASPNAEQAFKARESFAAAIGPVAQEVLGYLSTASLVYSDMPYNEDDDPSIQLDLFYDKGVNEIQVWSQNQAGGLATSLVTGAQELKLQTYTLDTAWSFLVRNLKRGQIPYVSMALNRAIEELAVRSDYQAWNVLLRALAEASTGGNSHVINVSTANQLGLVDFNALLTRSRIINRAFNGGTPTTRFSKITDMFVSPVAMQEIRGFVYQPMNTRATPNTDESTAVPLPDSIREEIYRASGAPSVYGINLIELLELGDAAAYNTIFSVHATANSISFTNASDTILVAVDTTREALVRPIAQNSDTGAQFTAQLDDQFNKRSGKVGYFGGVTEGRVVIDSRVLAGLIL